MEIVIDTSALLAVIVGEPQRGRIIARQEGMYAYDAYFLDCAFRHAAPLLTLDRGLMRAAQNIGIHLLEA